MYKKSYLLALLIVISAQLLVITNYHYSSILITDNYNHVERRSPNIATYIVPAKPVDMSPIWIFTRINGVKEGIQPKLYLNVDILIDLGLYIERFNKSSNGEITLNVYVYIGSELADSAYVELRDISGYLVATDYAINGTATFKVPRPLISSVYIIKAFYNSDDDQAFEYFRETSVTVLHTDNEITVNLSLASISDICGISETLISWSSTQPSPLMPLGENWFIAGIPGLPAVNTETSAAICSPVFYNYSLNLRIKSSVNGTIVAGNAVDRFAYDVLPNINLTNIPPLVLALVSSTLTNNEAFEETWGLSPEGWSWPSYKSLNVSVIVLDNNGYGSLRNISLDYSVEDTSWFRLPVYDAPLMNYVYNLSAQFNMLIESLNNMLTIFNCTIPRTNISIYVGYSIIPGQQPGTYVKFRAIIEEDGARFESPMGFYYVCKESGLPVLIVDPHVRLWLLKENSLQYSRVIGSSSRLGIPDNASIIHRGLLKFMSMINNSFVVFHNWHYLGETYRVVIVSPGTTIVNYLDAFQPRVIILSNLYLGIEDIEMLNWDLSTIRDEIGQPILNHLLNYIRKHHAGLIVTHGSLSDWVIWLSPDEKIKIGSRGHIGSSLNNIADNQSLASSLGLIWLPLWEYARDYAAELLCNSPYPWIGLLIGSTPLQIPYVPWNGTLKPTFEANYTGWEIPGEPIMIPNPYQELNKSYNAYTQIGWQLGAPRSIVYNALNHVNRSRDDIIEFYENMIKPMLNITGNNTDFDLRNSLEYTLKYALNDIRRGLASAIYTEHKIDASIRVRNLSRNIDLNISIPHNIVDRLMKLVPLKIVALSPDRLAGITIYDLYWDRNNGYRAVYFSFEVEASITNSGKTLLIQAVKWASNWTYMNLTGILRNSIRVPHRIIEAFNSIIADFKGTILLEHPIILAEEGTYRENIAFSRPSKLTMIIVHPWFNKVNVSLKGNAVITGITSYNGITVFRLDARKPGDITIEISGDASSTYSQGYIFIGIERKETTTTTTTTSTTTTTTRPITTTTKTTTPWLTKTTTIQKTTTIHETTTTTFTITSRTTTTMQTSEKPIETSTSLTETRVGGSINQTDIVLLMATILIGAIIILAVYYATRR